MDSLKKTQFIKSIIFLNTSEEITGDILETITDKKEIKKINFPELYTSLKTKLYGLVILYFKKTTPFMYRLKIFFPTQHNQNY